MKNICAGRQVLSYMNNLVDEEKTRRLDSISLARCYYCFFVVAKDNRAQQNLFFWLFLFQM